MRSILRPFMIAALPFGALAAVPAAAAEIQVQAQGPVAEIGATHTIMTAPDMAVVSAGVSTREMTAVAAMRANAAAMARVVAKIKALGVDPKDIQTQGISLNAQYRYNGENPRTFLGYDAGNRVTINLHDVARVGETLDALVEAGANDISGPSFALDNDEPVKAEARKAAFAEAQARALDYAKMAGYSGVRLLEIDESMSQQGPMPMVAEMRMVAAAPASKTPVEPGQIGTSVSLTAKFELTR
ncbi:MAG: SIMPL domain-containing protein [Sphingomonadales bacterium]|nr:SIMPL domain-containing protein [Sphingomonadales bacterium]MDE2570053.1 SIMPL domain-containing protein [Sphingomonadales bacterium]